jgi:hypothetical protein
MIGGCGTADGARGRRNLTIEHVREEEKVRANCKRDAMEVGNPGDSA